MKTHWSTLITTNSLYLPNISRRLRLTSNAKANRIGLKLHKQILFGQNKWQSTCKRTECLVFMLFSVNRTEKQTLNSRIMHVWCTVNNSTKQMFKMSPPASTRAFSRICQWSVDTSKQTVPCCSKCAQAVLGVQ